MSMSHKAFVFDTDAFDSELRGILLQALRTGDAGEIRVFIEANRTQLLDPYEGEPLDDGWEALLERKGVDEYGDFALTKYYDPRDDVGLGADWQLAGDRLRAHGLPDGIVLGVPLEVDGRSFDPGKQGSYFQTPATVRAENALVDGLADLAAVASMLEPAAASGKGLYITF